MNIKISASLKSPLMVGGKTLNSNYKESKDYIPGSVLRAAYARELIHRCPYEQENYWLDYKEKEECVGCKFQTICRDFTNICFPTLYPLGGKPYPLTAREEKYGEKGKKKIFDILRSRLLKEEKNKEEADWMRLAGIHKEGTAVKILHTVITRTAIDDYRHSAKAGALYTQNAVSEKFFCDNGELIDAVFSGMMQVEREQMEALKRIRNLHIGADTTRGLGVCSMTYSEENNETDTADKIKERVKRFHEDMLSEERFVILDLITDAYLKLEEIGGDSESKSSISDEMFMDFLEKSINLPAKYRLFRVYKSQEVLRGFNTAKAVQTDMRRRGRIVVKAGAVLVYKTSAKEFDAGELLELEQKGIGDHVEHGFGKVCICDTFHLEYDVLRREDKNE